MLLINKFTKRSEIMKLKKTKSVKKRVIIIISIVAAIFLIAGLVGYLSVSGILGKIHYSTGSSSGTVANEDLTSSQNSNQSDIDELQKQIEDQLKNSSTPITYDKDVFNVLLIGADNRDGFSGSRSDSMILFSVSKKSKKIVMTSIMRDTYVAIPGHGFSRLNSAYSYGGADLLLQTIEQNFKIKVDKYASVDFFSFINIIDQLGGVQVDVTEDELPVLNGYLREINKLKGLQPTDGALTKAGKGLTLTGKQALCYSRIRYVGNSDFQRTERQRTVLKQVISKVKKQNITQQYNILNSILPDVTTNLTKGELFSFILSSASYSTYQVVQQRIPIDGSYKNMVINHMDVLGIDFDKNISFLQKTVFE